jgi:hypothetical protein
MSAATVISIRRKRLIRHFREAGATSPAAAVTLESLGHRDSWIFEQMVRHRVFVAVEDGRYYLDEAAAGLFLRERRARALFFLAIFILIWVVAMIINSLLH